jgi:hypothetical protein
MATSSSKDPTAKQALRWVGRASVFSGRPDPEWEVTDDLASRLIAIWGRLPRHSGRASEPGGLGYRFSSLSSNDRRRWVAFDKVVRYESPEGTELRRDERREFERRLLESAPAGVLPPWVPNLNE